MKTKFLLCFLWVINTLQAQKNNEKDIQEVVITATRSERNLKDVPITTMVISGKTIEKSQITNFKDFLEQELAGVSFGNHGGSPEINMLGLGGKYILILINGERMAGETFDNVDYNRININEIERVEIVKGASSSLYGSNAIGGVINIITKQPKNKLDADISVRYGSFDEMNGGLFIGTKQNWGAVSLSASYKSKSPYLLRDTAPMERIYDNGNRVKNSLGKTYIAGYEDYGINPKLTLKISPKMDLELSTGYYFKERNAGDEQSKKVRVQFRNYANAGKLKIRLGEKRSLDVSGSFGRYEKYDHYLLLKEKEKNYENELWRGSVVYSQKLFQKHHIVIGAEALSEALLSFMFKSANGKRDAQTYSAFAQQEWALGSRFTLVTGGRYDHHSAFAGHLTLRLSGMYQWGENMTLRGGYSGGFRSPTLKELYTDWYHPYGGGFHIMGNEKMKAERSHNFTLSSDFKVKNFNVSIVGQYSYIKDKVATIWNTASRDTLHYANQEKAQILSTELMATYKKNGVLLNAGYAYTKDFGEGRNQARPHTMTARIEYQPRFLGKYAPTLSFGGKYFSAMEIVTEDYQGKYKVKYSPYSLWRLGVMWRLPYHFQLNAGIDNLFHYQPPFSNYYTTTAAGRTYYIGVKWSIH